MSVSVQMVDSGSVESGGSANDAVHLVALGKQKLGQIGAVLASDSGDQSPLLLSRSRGHGVDL